MEEKKLNSVENVNVVVENSSKEKVNKVSAKKAKAQAKANNILYKDILANLNKSTEGLLKTSFGVKKSDIYKEEIFSCSHSISESNTWDFNLVEKLKSP